MELAALLAVCLVVAFLVRRLAVAVLPASLVPLYYVGLRDGWWGNGVGDGWQVTAVVVTVATVAVTAAVARVAAQRQ